MRSPVMRISPWAATVIWANSARAGGGGGVCGPAPFGTGEASDLAVRVDHPVKAHGGSVPEHGDEQAPVVLLVEEPVQAVTVDFGGGLVALIFAVGDFNVLKLEGARAKRLRAGHFGLPEEAFAVELEERMSSLK